MGESDWCWEPPGWGSAVRKHRRPPPQFPFCAGSCLATKSGEGPTFFCSPSKSGEGPCPLVDLSSQQVPEGFRWRRNSESPEAHSLPWPTPVLGFIQGSVLSDRPWLIAQVFIWIYQGHGARLSGFCGSQHLQLAPGALTWQNYSQWLSSWWETVPSCHSQGSSIFVDNGYKLELNFIDKSMRHLAKFPEYTNFCYCSCEN